MRPANQIGREPLDRRREERFMAKVQPEPMSGCWLWDGAVGPRGYGRFSMPGEKTALSHRVAYAQFVAEVPRGMCVCHKCDTPCCVNPDHLFLGTDRDNAEDKYRKGRGNVGERAGGALLRREQVRTIRRAYADGASAHALAAEFGVTRSTIGQIATGARWAHVGGSVTNRGQVRGRRVARARLTEDDVRRIRRRHDGGERITDIARDFPITPQGVGDVVRRRTWKHVE